MLHACIDLKYIFLDFMCVYFLPPVRVVCLNLEVVVFQPCTGTTPDLGSVAHYTFYAIPTAPPVSTVFLYILIHPLYPTSPTQPPLISIVCHSIPSILDPPPTSYTSAKIRPPGRHPHLSPTRLRVLTCGDVYCVRLIPLLCPSPVTRSLSSPGGFPIAGPSISLVSSLLLPVFSSKY